MIEARDLRSFVRASACELDGADALREAEILIGFALGLTRAGLFAHGDRVLEAEERARCSQLLRSRSEGVPVAYLTGTREFWSLPLRVTPDVLIPRHETELLVAGALAKIPGNGEGISALDLGTGSGAVALALAKERRALEVWAIDQSPAALAVAEGNAERLGLQSVHFRLGDWFSALDPGLRFDVIVSNPPYVAEDDPHLVQGDLRFEPQQALTPGGNGLQAITDITLAARTWLKPSGWLLFEHGCAQADAVRELLARAGFSAISTQQDGAGLDRVTLGQSG